MAATPVPVPPSPMLDGPPPSPANPPGSPGYGGVQGIPGPPGAPPGSPEGGPDTAAKQLWQMGIEVDRAILALSQAAPGDIPEFGEARKLMQAGIAKLLSGKGAGLGAPAGATGAQFPGGGMSSGVPF